MSEDLWAVEKEVTQVFRNLIDKVGYDRADLLFDEAGLNDDFISEDEKLEVAQKLEGRDFRNISLLG